MAIKHQSVMFCKLKTNASVQKQVIITGTLCYISLPVGGATLLVFTTPYHPDRIGLREYTVYDL